MSLAKNSILYLISTLCIKATSFFLLPLYTHLVPPEVYGQVYVVSSMNVFVSMLLSLSLPICISRFYFDCKDEKQVRQQYSTILLLIFITSTLVITPFFIFRDLLASFLNLPVKYLVLGLFTSYLGVYYQVILALLYAMQKAKQVSVTSMLVGVFQIILQLILVISLEDKATALLGTMLLQSITTFIIFIIYSKPYLTFSFDFSETGKYLKYSLSQFPSDASSWLVNFTDRIFINKFIGSESAGIYGIGANIGMIPNMIFSSLNSAFTPFVNSQYKAIETTEEKDTQDLLRYKLSRVFLLISSILLIINVTFIVFSRDIVQLLNPAYADVIFVVIVMLVTSLMNSYRIIYMAPLAYNVKYIKAKSIIWVVAGILNITLNFFLIPLYGIYAACLNSLVTYTITFLLILYFSKKAFSIKYDWNSLLKVAGVSIVYAITLLLTSSCISIVVKCLLFIPYTYICFKHILDVDIVKLIKFIIHKFAGKNKAL